MINNYHIDDIRGKKVTIQCDQIDETKILDISLLSHNILTYGPIKGPSWESTKISFKM